jgi:hypothetical protein
MRILILFIAVAGGVVAAAGGQGLTANVDVTVFPASTPGQPPPTRDGFSVCIGTSADRDQFGRQLTPASGVANTAFLNLPTGQSVLITVEKSGFQGIEQTRTLEGGWSNHVQIQIRPGSGGPSCGTPSLAPQPMASATVNIAPAASGGLNPTGRDETIKIVAMTVNNGATRVMMDDQIQLFFRLAGPTPNEMRVSETSGNFPETWAAWTPYAVHPSGSPVVGTDVVNLPAPNRRIQSEMPRKTFYLQFRRQGRVSNIATATVDVNKKYIIAGGQAVEEAKRQGFVFLTTGFNLLNFVDVCTSGTHGGTGAFEFDAPGNLSVTGHCRFDIFIGRSLKTPWTFDSWTWDRTAAITCDPVVFHNDANPSTLAANVRVPFFKAGSAMLAPCAYSLTTVTLSGPAALPWQQAFAR